MRSKHFVAFLTRIGPRTCLLQSSFISHSLTHRTNAINCYREQTQKKIVGNEIVRLLWAMTDNLRRTYIISANKTLFVCLDYCTAHVCL